jgi:NADH dehydrogenase FAD-containing subunit
MLSRTYDAVVAGGGAAGVATVGALLHFAPKATVAWLVLFPLEPLTRSHDI